LISVAPTPLTEGVSSVCHVSVTLVITFNYVIFSNYDWVNVSVSCLVYVLVLHRVWFSCSCLFGVFFVLFKIWELLMSYGGWRCSLKMKVDMVFRLLICMSLFNMLGIYCLDCKWFSQSTLLLLLSTISCSCTYLNLNSYVISIIVMRLFMNGLDEKKLDCVISLKTQFK
jgi:hypothetical protein